MNNYVVLTDYWNGSHTPYTNILRDSITDEDLGQIQPEFLQKIINKSGAVDGDEIEIIIRRTGRRPFGDRKVRLIKPHTYAREIV